MSPAIVTASISLAFLFLSPVRVSAAAEPSATCVPRGLEVSSPASVFEPEEADETAPSEVRDPRDDGDRLAPWDQSWTPFDNDDDEELQA